MARMEFLKQNLIETTTSFTCDAGQTGTLSYLFDRNKALGFTSSDKATSTANPVLTYVFSPAKVISNVLLQNHNLKQFRVFYNSATANSLAVVSANSQTSTYLNFSSITVSSISIQMDDTITPSVEKKIGEWIVTEKRLQFERNPAHNDFEPITARKKIRHEMPDGGIAHFNISNKFKAKLKWKFVTDSFAASLKSVYEDALPFYFTPFPTTTGWDGIAHEVLWDNDYDFSNDENSRTQGQGGEIRLWETSNA